MSHKHDDNGNQFTERVDTGKGVIIVYICTTCSQCGTVVARDESHRENY